MRGNLKQKQKSMKKAKLLVVLVFLVFGAMAQPVLHWKFANETHEQVGADCYYKFDVMLSATQAGTYHSSMQIYFDYNTAAFGTAIVTNGNVTYTRLELMNEMFGGNYKYSTLPPGTQGADNKPYRYAVLTEATVVFGNPSFMTEVPLYPTFKGFLQFRIKVQDPTKLAGIAFVASEGGVPLMNEGQYYVPLGGTTETKYGVAPGYEGVYENDLLTSITSCGPVAPGCTTLVSPLDGATNVAIGTTVNWNAAATATGYKLSWNGGADMDLGNVLTYNPGGLNYFTNYTWKVTPYNAGGDAVGCATWGFTTMQIPAPGCATVASPLDGATGVGIDDNLYWNAAATATGYKLSFNGGLAMDLGNVLTYDPGTMAYNTLYTWAVTPYNAGGDAAGCGTWSFTTELAPVVEWVWTGAVDNDWFNALNWNPTSVPVNKDVKIPAVDAFPPIILGGAAVVANMTITGGASLVIAPSGNLTTNGVFTNDGAFTINSDATGAAGSFIDNGGLAGNGTYLYNRYLKDAPIMTNSGWHLVSSPVNNSVSGDFTGYWLNGWDENFFGTGTGYYVPVDPWGIETWPEWTMQLSYSGCPGEDYSYCNVPLGIGAGYAAKLDNGYVMYPPTTDPGGANQNFPCPVVIPMNDAWVGFGEDFLGAHPGFGDCIASATDPAFMSNINTGVYGLNVQNFSGNGWNLLGNPYSAPIDAAAFTAGFPAGVDGSIAYWDNNNLTYQYWAAGVGVPQIPATQGFFVHMTAPGQVMVGYNNAMRTHVGAGNYYKNDIPSLLELEATGNGLTDRTYVRFLNEANAGFDSKYDARKLSGAAANVPNIYTKGEGINLAINSMPAVETVPLYFNTENDGVFTIKAVETSEFTSVYLEDLKTGKVTDLLTDSYTFSYTKGEGDGRFLIHFGLFGNLDKNSVTIYSHMSNIYVNIPNAVDGKIMVYTTSGQMVSTIDAAQGINIIPIESPNNYYIVKVVSDIEAVTGKVYIR